MRMKIALCLLPLMLALATQMTMASTFTGSTESFVTATDPYNGLIRVSVQLISATTSCANGTAYAYEYNGSGVGSIWTATLLEAQTAGRSVIITGTGVCDAWGVEGVTAVQMN